MKIFTQSLILSLIVAATLFGEAAFGQSILNPADAVVTYNSASPPTQPAYGTIGKWVRTRRVSWNTDAYKAYIYKGTQFRLLFPKTYNPTAVDGKKYPMMIFYHGVGEASNTPYDNEYQLYHGGDVFLSAVNNGKFDGYVICLQTAGGWGNNEFSILRELIQYMTINNKLDPFHVTGNGLSGGGGGTWQMFLNNPTYNAGIIPMSGIDVTFSNNDVVTKCLYEQIWNTHGGLDGSPSPYTASVVNSAMQAAGANYLDKNYVTLGHGVWDSVWKEPDFWPFMNRAYASNPWPLFGRTQFCPTDAINVKMGLVAGFQAYQWRKNGTVITTATTNTLTVTEVGTYDARVQRDGNWSDWSHTPVVISIKAPTVTPPITVAGLMSTVIPALDNPGVTLKVPSGYASYNWQAVGSSATISTDSTLYVTTPGSYRVTVTEQFGCSSNFSDPFKVVDANGPSKPDAASNLVVSPVSKTSLRLDWAQNPTPVNNETNFEIYQAGAAGGPYKLVAIVGQDVATATINSLKSGTKYYYKVRAINATGAAPASNEASGSTIADVQAPTAPGNVTISGTTRNSISLTWTASTDDVGVTGYYVYVNGQKSYIVPGDQTTYTVYSLQYPNTYALTIRAVDQAGNLSPASGQVTGEPLANGLTYKMYTFASQPSNLPNYATLAPIQIGSVPTVSITNPAPPQSSNFGYLWEGFITIPTTGTYYFRTTSDDGSKLYLGARNGTTSPYNFSGTALVNNDGGHGSTSQNSSAQNLTAGIYPIAIAYYNGAGGGSISISWRTPSSGTSYVTIPTSAFVEGDISNGSVPATPSNLVATTISFNKIGLTWKDNSNNETGFEITRSTSATTGFVTIGSVGAGVQAYTDSTVSASTTYYYQVRAVGQYGQSPYTQNYTEAYWQFNNNYNDGSGNSRSLTTVATPTFSSSDKQEGTHALQLNGSTQAVTINNTGSFLQTAFAERTVAFWMKSSSNTSNRVIFDIGGSDNGLSLLLNSSQLIAGVASGSTRSTVSTSYTSTGWNHIAVVYNGDSLMLYVNGTLAASKTDLSFHSIGTTSNGSRIGQTNGTNANNTTGGFFSGLIDAFGIYNKAFASDVINTLRLQTYAQSTATTQVLPSAPTAPTGFSATALNTATIKLNWTDNVSNESNFEVYRSNGDNLNYVRIATLASNTSTYTDGGLFSNALYYYKVRAINAGGSSAYTAEASATTKDSVPVITDLANQSVRYGTTVSVNVSASSVNSGALTFAAYNLPPFASFVDNGNRTGTLTFAPVEADQANYTGLYVVVTDIFGGKDTTTFNLNVNNNYAPVIDTIANYTINENDTLTIPISASENNAANALTVSVNNLPSGFTLTPTGNGTANLFVHPSFAGAGVYNVQVKVDDANGLSTVRTFVLTVKDKDPNSKVYMRVQIKNPVGAPWNNLTGTTTTGLKDDAGNTTTMGLSIDPWWWFTGFDAGATTGNNSGLYPDNVSKEFYIFGAMGGPDSITATLTGLDPAQVYSISFFSSSVLDWQADNGTTTFRVGDKKVGLAVQGNTQNTVSISNLKALANGTIPIVIGKAVGSNIGFWNAIVVTTQFDDGTAPAAPTGLAASVTASQVQLSWNSPAYNATGFEVWRAPVSTGVYALVGTASGNSARSFADANITSNTQYSYKVRAINDHGQSAFSDPVTVTTLTRPPTINTVTDIALKNNAPQTVQVTTTGDGTSTLTLTATNLPPFVSFVDNGDGTGTLNINPTAGTIGVFPGVTVSVSNGVDAISSTSFTIAVTEPNVSSVYVNFTDGTMQAPKPWNSMVGPPFANTTISNLFDDSNTPTSISVKLVNGFSWTSATGMRPRNGTTVYPEAVTRNSFYEPGTTTRTIQISGLSSTKKYNIVVFGSYQDGLSALTNYTINGVTQSLQCSYNANKTVAFNALSPDASGNITLTVAKGTGSSNAFINSIVIQSYDPAPNPLLNPTDLRILSTSKTTMSLQWQDRSANETGYEVWRSTNGGSYSQVASVGQNVTTYLDRNLTPNTTYFYIVRAARNTTKSDYSNVVTATTYAYQVYINFTASSVAPLPWNNLMAPPQVGYVWDNFNDSTGAPTSVGMTVTREFAGVQSLGNVTGNNSGVFPDAVLLDDYILFPGQKGGLKLQGLNLSQKYDLTFLPCTTTWGDNTTAYAIGGDTVLLSGSLNSTALVTMFGKAADNNGEMDLDVFPYTTSSQAGLINAWIVQGYTPYTGSNPNVPASAGQNLRLATAATSNQYVNNGATLNTDTVVHAYPNPFHDNLTLSVPAVSNDKVMVSVYDINGKMMIAKQYSSLVAGSNYLKLDEVTSLNSGVYIVRVAYASGKTTTFKLMKQ
ncbi:MAG: fibronectin type III domain-containing protein [Bacteroidetes bacterium]|nr:fibronectin type III domain-containing protein [Bacteroidota bacterium]